MATINLLAGTMAITTGDSMTKINTNFTNLNSDKIETSVIDTDTTLSANSDSKIPSQKAVKAYVDSGGIPTFNVYNIANSTMSLTTTASQKVIVWAKGNATGGATGAGVDVLLKYNSVTKDTTSFTSQNFQENTFALQYTETPGAATHTIEVTGTNGVSNVSIIALVIG